MMENSKVNTQNNNDFANDERRLLNAVYSKSILSHRDQWLDNVCPVIRQNDFDTCGGSYNDGDYDTHNGYRQAYNIYLDQFENC